MKEKKISVTGMRMLWMESPARNAIKLVEFKYPWWEMHHAKIMSQTNLSICLSQIWKIPQRIYKKEPKLWCYFTIYFIAKDLFLLLNKTFVCLLFLIIISSEKYWRKYTHYATLLSISLAYDEHQYDWTMPAACCWDELPPWELPRSSKARKKVFCFSIFFFLFSFFPLIPHRKQTPN